MNALIGLMIAAAALTAYGIWRERGQPKVAQPQVIVETRQRDRGANFHSAGLVAANLAWRIGAVATFIYLTFFDGYAYNWWNWIIAILANSFLAAIWPIYWLILRPIMG